MIKIEGGTCPAGPSQIPLLGPEGPGEHKTTLDSNKSQLLPQGEEPGMGDLHGLSNQFFQHFLAGISILNLTRCHSL